MKPIRIRLLHSCTLLWLALACSAAHALEFECIATNEQRFIRLEIPGENNLCEVSVTLQNGERDVKWYANSNSTFCTEKTIELKTKYETQWGFSCTKWPDTDGIDKLNPRHRLILDTELKKQLQTAKQKSGEFIVTAVKATASSVSADQQSVLAIQFFRQGDKLSHHDETHVIRDNGTTWFTEAKIASLSSYIPKQNEYKVHSALVSTIDDSGALGVTTLVSGLQQDCYGNQVFSTNSSGELQARTPHRFVCQ